MPTYAYACTACDHRFEAVQSFTDDTLTECPTCGGRVRKVFSAVGVVFKGSGFYRNDSRKPAGAGKSNGKSDGRSDGKVDGRSDRASESSTSDGMESAAGAGKDGTKERSSSSTSNGSSGSSSSAGSSGSPGSPGSSDKQAKPSTAGSAA